MGQKMIIDRAEIERIQKSITTGFMTVTCIIILCAVLSFIIIPYPVINIIAGIAFIVTAFVMYWSKKKNGDLQVYFIKKPLIHKRLKDVTCAEDIEAAFFEFGGSECMANDKTYANIAEGDMLYVMYNARNNHIIDSYAVKEYDIDPTLDIR